tara:strand:- start:1162 stop:1341 length:180 start_codon:yes stop_codon:yes gene_type:complete
MADTNLVKVEKKLDKIDDLVADIKELINKHKEYDDGNIVDEDDDNEWEDEELDEEDEKE